MLRAVARRCPEALIWLETCYGQHSGLFVGGETIMSMRGIQQGDPCGPASFCWALQDICEALEEITEWQCWYMDDGLVLGDEEQLTAALTKIMSMSQVMGIDVNLVKCSLWGPGFADGTGHLPDSCPLKTVPVVRWGPGSGIKVLGVPVCCPEREEGGVNDRFAKSVWQERVSQAARAKKLHC